MDLKTLARQHEKFAATQARKAERAARKVADKAERTRQWTLTKEGWRKTREGRERDADLAQQRRLEDADPDYAG